MKPNTLVMTPFGNTRIPPPKVTMVLPQVRWVNVIPPLAEASLLESRTTPRPVPRLGQVLESVNSWLSAVASRPLVLDSVVTAVGLLGPIPVVLRVAIVRSWVWTMVLSVLCLRPTQFSVILIRPGTRLRCWASRMLTRVNVPPQLPWFVMRLPQTLMVYRVMVMRILRSMSRSSTVKFLVMPERGGLTMLW